GRLRVSGGVVEEDAATVDHRLVARADVGVSPRAAELEDGVAEGPDEAVEARRVARRQRRVVHQAVAASGGVPDLGVAARVITHAKADDAREPDVGIESEVDGELSGGGAARCFALLFVGSAAQHERQRGPDAVRAAAPCYDDGFFESSHLLDVRFDDSISLVVRETGRHPELSPTEPVWYGPVTWKEPEPALPLEPGAGELEPRQLILVLPREQSRNTEDPHDLLPLGGVEDMARKFEHTLHSQLGWGWKLSTPSGDVIPVGRPVIPVGHHGWHGSVKGERRVEHESALVGGDEDAVNSFELGAVGEGARTAFRSPPLSGWLDRGSNRTSMTRLNPSGGTSPSSPRSCCPPSMRSSPSAFSPFPKIRLCWMASFVV